MLQHLLLCTLTYERQKEANNRLSHLHFHLTVVNFGWLVSFWQPVSGGATEMAGQRLRFC